MYEVAYVQDDLELILGLKDVSSQRDTGVNETVTSGFNMLDFNATKTFDLGKQRTATLSFFAKNLLDEVARNHVSFVKSEVPLPGRNLGLRLQVTL
jgi:iron complex outermembrane recepter protein